MDDIVGTAEAARRLGVSPQRARALWHQGALPGRMVANRLLLDRSAVLDMAERKRPATRPLSARNAWTLLFLLAGQKPMWASASELSRLRAAIFVRDEPALAELVRSRARSTRFAGSAGAGEYVLRDKHGVLAGGTLAHRWTDLVDDGTAEVYVTDSDGKHLVDRLRLWPDPHGSIVVHTVRDELGDVLHGRREMPLPVVAVDLLDSNEPRSQRAASALWREAVEHWRNTAEPLRVRRTKGAR